MRGVITAILALGALASGLVGAPVAMRAQETPAGSAPPAAAPDRSTERPPETESQAAPAPRPTARPGIRVTPAPQSRPESGAGTAPDGTAAAEVEAKTKSETGTQPGAVTSAGDAAHAGSADRDAGSESGDDTPGQDRATTDSTTTEDPTQAGHAPDQTPAQTNSAAPSPTAPASQGRLIPPEEMPPPAPLGPPLYQQLRESDFDDAACRLALRVMGVGYEQSAAITDPGQRDCGIARPVIVTEILPGIALDSPAPMRCEAALQMARWMRDVVVPAASHLPRAPRPKRLELGTTYQCRGVVGGASAERLSEHALGNAIDIAAFGLDDGTRLAVSPPEDRGDMAVAFQKAVQASACLYFATVLGPGSNEAHDDHLHLDVKARRGGFRLCQ